MSEALLELNGLNGWYRKGSPVLRDLSFTLGKGEVVGLIGLNGAGKTTLIRILSGLMDSFTAEGVAFAGGAADVRSEAFRRQRYTVFAEDGSFGCFTFREYVSFVFAAYGRPVPDLTPLVEGFRFGEYEHRLLKDLSMGNRRKVSLITAFALKPPLLLLDEPVNGLDFQSTEFLYSLIAGYRQHGTLLFSSHVLESITLTSDRVLVLERGGIARTFAGGEITADNVRKVLKQDHAV